MSFGRPARLGAGCCELLRAAVAAVVGQQWLELEPAKDEVMGRPGVKLQWGHLVRLSGAIVVAGTGCRKFRGQATHWGFLGRPVGAVFGVDSGQGESWAQAALGLAAGTEVAGAAGIPRYKWHQAGSYNEGRLEPGVSLGKPL